MNSWRTGLPAFRLVAFGQIISSLGDEISGFAITVWAYQKTGSVTVLGLLLFFTIIPYLIALPFAGAIVDRSNRRLMMLLTDMAAFIYTVALLVLQLAGVLEVWHMYIGVTFIGVALAFREPAFYSTMSLMVKKEDIPKAAGALGLAESTRTLGGPVIGAILYPLIGLEGTLIVDIATFAASFGALLFISVPQPPPPTVPMKIKWLEETTFGFKYIFKRSSLLGLVLCSSFFNIAFGIGQAVQPALILARGDTTALAVVRTAAGIGGLVGGLAVSAFGAPQRRIIGVLLGIGIYGLGLAIMGVGQNVWVWSIGGFVGMAFFTLLPASGSAIWQRKIAPEYQGKVTAARRFMGFVATPIGALLAGPLTDGVLTPAMRSGGSLEGVFGWIVGSGAGAGLALALLLCGVWQIGVALIAWLGPTVRNVEDLEPDFVAPAPAS